MRIINEALLKEYRTPGPCEYCGNYSKQRQPHHALVFRGLGGGTRIDHPFNLIALGGPFSCPCHEDAHRGRILRCDFLAIIAAREGRLQDEILAELDRIQKASKWRSA